jgi:predicted Zn-dependent protease
MAEVLLARNQYAESLPYLEKSLKAKPQMLSRVHALMGKSYAELGKTQEAIAQLNMGESSDEDGSIQYLLARLYRQLGDNAGATAAIEKMKTIKQQRRQRGFKRVQDPDLSAIESPLRPAPTP